MDDFKYLGVNINHEDNMHSELRQRIHVDNRAYFTKNTMLSSKTMSWKTKDKLYSGCIRPVKHGQPLRATKTNCYILRGKF